MKEIKLSNSWRVQSYFIIRGPIGGRNKLYISVGALVKQFGFNIKTLRNALTKSGERNKGSYLFFKDNGILYIDYDSIPNNCKAKIKLPDSSNSAYEILKSRDEINEDINKDIEFKFLKVEFKELYHNRWPSYLTYYCNKITDENERILYAKSHSLIKGILDGIKSKWPHKVLYEAYRQLMIEEIDAESQPIFYVLNYHYFLRKISEFNRTNIPDTLIHKSLGQPREYKVKMTGQIKAFIRLLLRDPRRFFISAIIRKVKRKFNVELSDSTIKTLKRDSLDRNVLEYDSNGIIHSRQNGLPKIIRFLAEAAGEHFQGDWYDVQIYCLINNVVRTVVAYVVIDVFSCKILGWSIAEKKSAEQAKEAFKMAFVNHNILPEEIIIDSDPIYKGSVFKWFLKKLNNLGVIISNGFPGIPTWRAEIESTFATFQKLHADKPYYIGEGIRSKNVAGNPPEEIRKKLYKDKVNMLSFNELKVEFGKMVEEYNDMTNKRSKKISPKDTFRLNPSKRSIDLNHWVIPLLFWKTKLRKRIKNDGRIDLQINNIEYCYQVTSTEIFWRYKNTDVRMCYDEENLGEIYIYECGSNKFIGAIEPRMELRRENKKEVLAKQRKILRNIQDFRRNSIKHDELLAQGLESVAPSFNQKSLAEKLIKRKMKLEEFEKEVISVKVHD